MNEFIKRGYTNPDLDLNEEEGEIVCPDCNGWGVRYHLDENVVANCHYCCGAGKMDWIDNTRGGLINPSTAGYSNGTFYAFPKNRSGKSFPVQRFKKGIDSKSVISK